MAGKNTRAEGSDGVVGTREHERTKVEDRFKFQTGRVGYLKNALED